MASTRLAAGCVTLPAPPDHAYELRLADGEPSAGALDWTATEDGRAIHHRTEPEAGAWDVLVRDLLGALIPEHML